MTTEKRKELLRGRDVIEEFNLGRDLTYQLLHLMPHIKVGKSGRGEAVLVRRMDVLMLLRRASQEQADLWDIVRQHTPTTLRAWLETPLPPALEAQVIRGNE